MSGGVVVLHVYVGGGGVVVLHVYVGGCSSTSCLSKPLMFTRILQHVLECMKGLQPCTCACSVQIGNLYNTLH